MVGGGGGGPGALEGWTDSSGRTKVIQFGSDFVAFCRYAPGYSEDLLASPFLSLRA